MSTKTTTYTAAVSQEIPGVTATLSKSTGILSTDSVTLSVQVAQADENGKITVSVDGCTADKTELTLTNGDPLNATVTLTNFTKNATVTLTYETV